MVALVARAFFPVQGWHVMIACKYDQLIFFGSFHFLSKNVVILCFLYARRLLARRLLLLSIQFWRQLHALASKKNGEKLRNRVKIWHLEIEASGKF
jgi:hypothetical protein